jgi:primosomal replication protein N
VNQLKLVASILEKSALRYSPAGIPIANAILVHSSMQIQAGVERQVEMEIAVLAAGEISKSFLAIELGQVQEFTGFLARKNRNSKSLVFHITEFKNVEA